MLPQIIKSAASSCVVKALCKKANSRKQMRAFLVKLAADKLQNAYKFAPRGSTTQHMSPVPGAKGREQLLRPSMNKASFDAASAPKLPGAPAAPKAPAALKVPAAPKAPAALKAPGSSSPASLDTAYDLANTQNSPGTNFYSRQNPTYAAMRGPDPARLAPKPKMRPGMSNEINYGTGPSGNPVIADIVPGGTMPVGRDMVRTEAERSSDIAKQRNFNERTRAARAAAASGQAAPGSPALTQLLAGMTPSQRLAYKKQNVFNSPDAYANRNQTASQELARRSASSAPTSPELAPVPIPEPAEAPPVSTPLPEAPVPESLPTPSAVPQQPVAQVAPQSIPDVSSVMQSPYSQMLEQGQNVAPKSISNMLPANITGFDPRSLFGLAGRQSGQQLANPNMLYELFSKMRGGLGNGLQNLSSLFATPPDDFRF